VRDVTLRHHLVAEVYERERRYRELFEANPNMMWIYDSRSLKFLAVNDAAVAQYGYSRDEFLAMRLTDIRPPEDQARLAAALQEEEGMAFLGDAPRIWRHQAKNGRPILAEVTRHPIVFQGCAAQLAMVADVTARLASESRLRDRQSRLSRQLGEAARHAAVHERIARGLAEGGHLPEALRQRVARLLELSRGEVCEPRRIELSEVAQEEITALRLRDPGRRVHVDIEPHLACDGDPAQVRELIRELLANAWEFSRQRIHAWIRVGRCEEAPGRWFVSDNGCGFDSGLQGQLFQPFERSHSHAEHQGDGLGLALARAVAERHGGRVWAESRPGQGTTFFFELAPGCGGAAPHVQEVVIDSALPAD
jgi:PAS domain S-box-containing protein